MHRVREAIEPWSPYLRDDLPRSRGRVSLVAATWRYCMMRFGLSAGEIAAAFAPGGGEADRSQVAAAASLVGGLFVEGVFPTWARPVGGGEPVEIPAGHWELDDFLPRFSTGALDMARPFDAESPPTHHVFVDDATLQSLLDACCVDLPGYGDVVPRREHARSAAIGSGVSGATDPPVTDPDGPGEVPAWPGRDGVLRMRQVVERTGLSRTTVYDRIARGEFPAPLDLGGRMSGWSATEVDDWIAPRDRRA